MSMAVKGKSLVALACMVLATVFSACTEAGIEDEYHDWRSRNDAFIDSLSEAAASYRDKGVTPENASEGDMFRLLSYKKDPSVEGYPYDYVYCKVMQKGDGTDSPLFSDAVKFHYRGSLIPSDKHPLGYIFDQSYKSADIDPTTSIPAVYSIQSLVEGLMTAFPYMKKGDRWKIYIPYQMGYHDDESTSVPAFSTLIFDIRLEEFAHFASELQ